MASRRPAVSPRVVARRVAALTAMQVQLRIELRDVKPLVWRRILVPESVTLAKLHLVLQWTMGWTNSHLHEYEIARQRYGLPSDEDDWPGAQPLNDERRVRLKPLIESGLRRFTYQYDFGDNWEHVIKVEDLVAPKSGAPPIVCLAGANACPPEDVGGYPGYAEFLEVLADPAHEEHAHMLSWAGGTFDPKAFDLAEINRRLATIKP